MKKSIILFICIIAAHIAVGQGVGVGTATPDASAKLDVSSTTQGMLVPRMTTAQRTTIPTPATGLLVFDLTTNSFWFKGGTMWIELVDSSNIVVQKSGANIYMGMNGNVGIGTSTPTTKLEVLTPTNTLGITHTDGDIRLSTRITDTSAIIRTTTEHPITLQAGSSITNFTLPPSGGAYIGSGNQTPMPGTTLHVEGNTSLIGLVGVGTGSPTSKLDVKTTALFPAMTLRNDNVTLNVVMESDTAVIKTTTASAIQLNANNGINHLTIASSGMVGIGNSSPDLPLSFANTFGGKIAFKKTAASYYGFGVSPGELHIHSDGPGSDILFGHNSGVFAELARMKGTGRFGIGTNNPTAMLSVIRGTSPDGTAAFLGTTHNSYFNKGSNEDTYINGGKAGSNVLLNSAAGLGFVGIGTTSPLQMLHVAGGGFFGGALGLGIVAPIFPLHFSAASGDKIGLSGSAGALFGFGIQPNLMQIIAPTTSDDIGFGTGSSNTFSEKMRLTGDGDLGIGTDSPSTKLDVNGDANISGGLTVGLGLAVGLGVAVGGGLGVGGTVGVGTQTPDPSAILDLTSTDKGLLLPRMTSTEREAIDTPAEGLTVYDNTTNSPWYYDENNWEEMKPDTNSFTTEVFRNGPDMIYMGLNDRVGIGTSTPTYKLQVVTVANMDGISLTDGNVDVVTKVSNDDDHGGSIGTNSNHKFELFSNGGESQFVLSPTGNIGIGLSPNHKVDIASAPRTGTHPIARPLYVTGNIGTNADGMEFRKSDGTQGVGIGSNTIYGAVAGQALRIEAKGDTGTVKIATNGTERMFVSGAGNVGIGNATPHAPLQFSNELKKRKIVLYEQENNDHKFSGIGTAAWPYEGSMRYHVHDTSAKHTFYAGKLVDPTRSTKELMRIQGDGNVGIGIDTAAIATNRLDVATVKRTGTHPAGLGLYVTGNIEPESYGMEIRESDGTQGIGIGSNTIYGTDAVQDLRLKAKGATGKLSFVTNNVEQMVILGTGDVSIGTKLGIGTLTPHATLQLAGVPATRMLILNEVGNNDHQFVGFGMVANSLQHQSLGDHIFRTGINSTTSKELVRMTSGGNVGIGVNSPLATLELARGTGNNGTLMIKGTTQASHFNFSTDEHTYIRGGKANSNVLLNDVGGLGNVGIGTALPFQKLHVEGITYISQKLGIGNNLPNAPLQFNNDANVNRKIVLYEGTPNDHQYYGLGINPSIFRYQVSNENDNHVFYAGSNASSSKELMRIHGSGNVGIGGTSIIPTNKLDVAAVTRTGSHPSNLPLYVTGNIGTNTGGMEIRKTDGTQGIGIGSTTVYATGAIQDLRMEAKGATGNMILSTNNTEKMRVTGDGKVGIGITTPGSTLEIARGTAEFGTMQINGTNHNSHFNYGSPEDTYIRGGKPGAKVIINESGGLGNVGIGTDNPLQKLHVSGNVAVNGNVGIGNTAPHAPLQFNSTDANRKIVLKEFNDNDHQFTGFGTSPDGLSYQVPHDENSHIFYAGNTSPGSNELMRIEGTGNVGIGVTNPNEKLEVNGNVVVSGELKAGVVREHIDHIVPYPTNFGEYSCGCPEGTKVIGGGWVGPGLDVVGSFPHPYMTSWVVYVNNLSFVQKVVTVYAICARIGN